MTVWFPAISHSNSLISCLEHCQNNDTKMLPIFIVHYKPLQHTRTGRNNMSLWLTSHSILKCFLLMCHILFICTLCKIFCCSIVNMTFNHQLLATFISMLAFKQVNGDRRMDRQGKMHNEAYQRDSQKITKIIGYRQLSTTTSYKHQLLMTDCTHLCQKN